MEEENVFLEILEECVAKGARLDCGTFKPGILLAIEKDLAKKCPESSLKVKPHIESKLKFWREQHGIVFDMLNQSGFG